MRKPLSSTAIALLGAGALLVSACVGGGEAAFVPVDRPGDGVEIVAARVDSSAGYVPTAVYVALLEELGYTVTDPARNEFPPAEGYRALGLGEVDFWAGGRYPGDLVWHDTELDDGATVGDNVVVLGDQMPDGALEGLLITRSVADDNEIVSLDQINGDPALVELFDTDGNGLANIFGCPEDWTCHDVIDALVERNGWSNLEQTRTVFDGMMEESVNRVDADDPTLQYVWSPSGHLAQLVPGENVRWLSLGSVDLVCDGSDPCAPEWAFAEVEPASLGDRCTQDPCHLGWPTADIRVTANSGFAEANPAAARLLELVTIGVDDAVGFHFRFQNGEDTEPDVTGMAAEWIDDHRDEVDRWLAEAEAAG